MVSHIEGRKQTEREDRVLRKIFGPKKDEVTGEWRKLHSEELHILYLSPNIISQIKSRRMRWAGHVACMGQERKMYMVMVGKPEGRDHLEDKHIDGRRQVGRRADVDTEVRGKISCLCWGSNLGRPVHSQALY
jgi:hypothetical protein